jgi:hypothetical protein
MDRSPTTHGRDEEFMYDFGEKARRKENRMNTETYVGEQYKMDPTEIR